MKFRSILAISVILCMVMAMSMTAHAANFPNRTIRILVPFSAGGATDLMARILAPAMSSRLGDIDIIVENRPGGGGAISVMELITSPADGHTLMIHTVNDASLTPILTDVAYTPQDIAPIAQTTTLPTTIFVRAESEIETVADLLSMAQENYGRMTFGTTGAGSLHHIIAEAFQFAAGYPGILTHVPFNSGPESIAAVMGGHVDVVFGNASYGTSHVRNQGVMRGIATSSGTGCPILPEMPTFRSLGFDVAYESWWGFGAPAGTPEEILDLLDGVIRDTMADPEVIQSLMNVGMVPSYLSRSDFTAMWRGQYYEMRELLTSIGLIE